ncbi:MAG: VOC family protein [Thermotogota bacterium]|nr:VOC family protein [Thermotogota bacterium]
MDFCWITVLINELEESLEFYTRLLGMKIFERFRSGDDVEIAMLGEEDSTKIELIDDNNYDVKLKSKGISIGFEVDSMNAAMKYVKNSGIEIKSGPISPNHSISFFFIEDPNDIEIQWLKTKKYSI